MNGIKIKNTVYSVKFSFLLFNALIFLLRENSVIMNFYAVCIIHELGHLFAIGITGGKIKSVVFSGTGVVITPEKNSEFFVMLAGPCANLAVFVIFSIMGVGQTFRLLNMGTALYNLLPYRQLDGGSALALLTDGSPHERTVNTVLTCIKIMFSVFLLGISLFCGRDFVPLFLVSLILFVSERGLS